MNRKHFKKIEHLDFNSLITSESLDDKTSQVLFRMLLCNISRLSDIPKEFIFQDRGLYAAVFRADTTSVERYKEDLQIMANHIMCFEQEYLSFAKLYEDMHWGICRCKDDKNDNGQKEQRTLCTDA